MNSLKWVIFSISIYLQNYHESKLDSKYLALLKYVSYYRAFPNLPDSESINYELLNENYKKNAIKNIFLFAVAGCAH